MRRETRKEARIRQLAFKDDYLDVYNGLKPGKPKYCKLTCLPPRHAVKSSTPTP